VISGKCSSLRKYPSTDGTPPKAMADGAQAGEFIQNTKIKIKHEDFGLIFVLVCLFLLRPEYGTTA
jgi:hypothetical protein